MSNEEKSGLKHWVPAFVLMVCVVLAFFDKISIAVLFSDPHFQSSMGIAEDKAKLGWLMTSFLLAYGFSSVFLSFLGDIFNPYMGQSFIPGTSAKPKHPLSCGCNWFRPCNSNRCFDC